VKCPQCESQNPPNCRICQACGAPLIPSPVVEQPKLGIAEGVEYPHPTHHYETEQMNRLTELVALLFEGEDLFVELEDHLVMMSDNFHEFETQYAEKMQELLVREASRKPEDQYNTKLSYTLRTGLQLFEEGRAAFQQFFETESEDPDELEAAFVKVRDGNDYVCLALELAQIRFQELQKVLQQREK